MMRRGGNAGPSDPADGAPSASIARCERRPKMTTPIEDLKAEAKRLRAALSDSGQAISHSQSLETLARQRGYRDWNTLRAAASLAADGRNAPKAPVALGETVSGRYLGREFSAEVLGVSALSDGRFRIKLDLETPVDVSQFPSMQVLRRRLNANVKPNGETVERTSDGAPQLRLHL